MRYGIMTQRQTQQEFLNRGLENIIPAKGSPTEGASYSYVDNNVQNRNTYLYKLEDIDLSGKSTFHDPVSAVPRGIYGTGR